MCFFINLPLGVPVALILFLFPVPERVKKPRAIEVLRDLPKKLDLIGFAILSAATVQLFLALEYGGNKYSWKSATVIGLFCGSAATFLLLGGWFWHKKEHSLIPYSLLMKPTIFCSSFVFAFFMSRQLSTSYYLVSISQMILYLMSTY
jgi:MFS family permease